MGADLQGQHPCHVLSDQGGRAAHEAGQCDHQYGVDQFRSSQSHAARLRNDQGRDSKFHRRPRAAACKEGYSRQRGGPGPIWTPLIPSTLPEDSVVNFGKQVPMQRPGQLAELATAYVMLADPLSSYVSGATIDVTGGKPIL
jgi:Enoyl-(Acyl carrier protein) reductase